MTDSWPPFITIEPGKFSSVHFLRAVDGRQFHVFWPRYGATEPTWDYATVRVEVQKPKSRGDTTWRRLNHGHGGDRDLVMRTMRHLAVVIERHVRTLGQPDAAHPPV